MIILVKVESLWLKITHQVNNYLKIVKRQLREDKCTNYHKEEGHNHNRE